MPRIPRNVIDTSFFHIMCQGNNKEFIFKNEEDISTYKRLIKKYKNDDMEVIAYCIMNNHAHLLLYVNNIKVLTKFMHKVNTVYGIYYNKKYDKVGYVFRDRFKSEPICSRYYLLKCIDYIHLNPVKANLCKYPEMYEYSSYKEYFGKKYIISDKGINLAFNSCEIVYKIKDTKLDFMDIETKEEKCKRIILEFLKDNNLTKEEVIKNKNKMKELIKKLNIENRISYRIIENEIGLKKDKLRRMVI